MGRSDVPLYQVDAFTGAPFGGNPAAVCLLAGSVLPLSDDLRQKIAAENNLAETAYVEPIEETAGLDSGSLAPFASRSRFRLRWFTPTVEVPLCGHATLAAAHVLFQECGNPSDELHFETHSGTLSVKRTSLTAPSGHSAAGAALAALEMQLPLVPPADQLPPSLAGGPTSPALAQLVAACTGGAGEVHEVGMAAAGGLNYLLLSLGRCADAVKKLEGIRPDVPGMVAAVGEGEVRGVIVTAASDGTPSAGGISYDVASRFFAPWCGIDEDPVTGSAHCVLAPFWTQRLGRTSLLARQASPRGGDVWMAVAEGGEGGAAGGAGGGGGGGGGVRVTGQAVTVIRGTLLL